MFENLNKLISRFTGEGDRPSADDWKEDSMAGEVAVEMEASERSTGEEIIANESKLIREKAEAEARRIHNNKNLEN